MPHTYKKTFHPNKFCFYVDSTLIVIQRESEKSFEKADFELKLLQRVGFQKKILQSVRF